MFALCVRVLRVQSEIELRCRPQQIPHICTINLASRCHPLRSPSKCLSSTAIAIALGTFEECWATEQLRNWATEKLREFKANQGQNHIGQLRLPSIKRFACKIVARICIFKTLEKLMSCLLQRNSPNLIEFCASSLITVNISSTSIALIKCTIKLNAYYTQSSVKHSHVKTLLMVLKTWKVFPIMITELYRLTTNSSSSLRKYLSYEIEIRFLN